jgi:hypothetical protein
MPSAEKRPGKFFAGSENKPPIEGPIIVPTLQTKGMTAYAFAADSQYLRVLVSPNVLTFMLRVGDHFANHCLDYTHIAIESSA